MLSISTGKASWDLIFVLLLVGYSLPAFIFYGCQAFSLNLRLSKHKRSDKDG
jgi:hypothetical protein